jgi:hypothetical protein
LPTKNLFLKKVCRKEVKRMEDEERKWVYSHCDHMNEPDWVSEVVVLAFKQQFGSETISGYRKGNFAFFILYSEAGRTKGLWF